MLSPCDERWVGRKEDQPGGTESFGWNSGKMRLFVPFRRRERQVRK